MFTDFYDSLLQELTMNHRKIASVFVMTSLAFSITGSAFAGNDGSLGATSEGNLELDLQVLDSVEISSLDDIDFGTYGGTNTGGINQGDAFCVYVNGGDGYTITPTSSNGSFALLGDTNAETIAYTVKLVGAATGASSASASSYAGATATFTGSNSRDCDSANNASVDISIDEQDIRDVATDTYQDTLILTVNPV
jgi:hypothetical protein